ncbi:hypothetical protein P7C70_g8050, partial [Phenoliferia sp. Uapishka_3]
MSSSKGSRRPSGSNSTTEPSSSSAGPPKSRSKAENKTTVSQQPNKNGETPTSSQDDTAEQNRSAATHAQTLVVLKEPATRNRVRSNSILSLNEAKEKGSPALKKILQFADDENYVGMTYQPKTRHTKESDNHDEVNKLWITMERGRETYQDKGKGCNQSKSSPPPRGRRTSDMGAIGIGANDCLDASQICGAVANRFSALEEENGESEEESQPESEHDEARPHPQRHTAARAPDEGPSNDSSDTGSGDDHREPLRCHCAITEPQSVSVNPETRTTQISRTSLKL